MKVAQELYEGVNLGAENGGSHGLITYMRTDSLRISAEASEAAKAYIGEKYGEKYYPEAPRVYKTDANAQDAHEAIRPSDLSLEPDKIKKSLTQDQYKLYRLIWNRFVASQMANAELDTVSADVSANGQMFRANGYTVRFAGFMSVYEESEEDKAPDDDAPEKTKLPELTAGESLTLDSIDPAQHFTEPPPRYNEASLIKFLKEKGIGRPSTYTPIITTIIARGYVERDGKMLKPTPLGEITTKLMTESFPDIVDYRFTAQMEDELDEIENGSRTMLDVLKNFYSGFEKDLEKAESTVEKCVDLPVEETDIVCEKCGAKMIIKNGRYGKFAACPNYPTCKNTKPLRPDGTVDTGNGSEGEKTDLKCEKCGSDMVLRTGRYGSFYACSKYPECKFTKRIAKGIGIKCPKCGAEIVCKHGKNRTTFYSCERYPDCDFSSWDLPLDEKCPKCGKPLYRKKGKPLIICHDESCGYKRQAEPKPESGENGEGGSENE